MNKMKKTFTQNKSNSIFITLPNGNNISTIWGSGSYTENYNYEYKDGFGKVDLMKTYSDIIKEGSNDVEVMVGCSELVMELLENKYSEESSGGGVFGHLDFTKWLDILNTLAKHGK